MTSSLRSGMLGADPVGAPLGCWRNAIAQISIRSQTIFLVIALAAAVALWLARETFAVFVTQFGMSELAAPTPNGKDQGVPVIVRPVDRARNDATVAAVGTGRARRSVMIYPKSDGVIVAFEPKAGDRVQKGELLFRLDDAKAKLAVEIAQRNLDVARRLFERAERLEQRKVNSGASVDDARTAFERAALVVKQAEEARSDLSVTAPFDGVVGLPKVDIGERVTSATPVISLDMRQEIHVEFELPEKYLGQIAIGNQVSANTPSQGDRQLSGRVDYVDSRVNPTSRTATIRAVFDNSGDELRPGMSFVIRLVIAGEAYPRVPELSLQWLKGESFVWLVRDGKARKVLVRVVRRQNGFVLVDGELATGEFVVVEGVQRLREGRNVSIADGRPDAPGITSDEAGGGNPPGKG
jgi:membrane fusion protein, multidrug efflux system